MMPLLPPLSEKTMKGILALLLLLTVTLLLIDVSKWYSDIRFLYNTEKSNQTKNSLDETTLMIESLPEVHLFGQAYTHDQDVPLSDLQLNITGIVKTENAVSKVYISAQGQPSKIYKIGDRLPEGVKVYDITKDAVIFEHNNRLEKLPLARQPLEFKNRTHEEQP